VSILRRPGGSGGSGSRSSWTRDGCGGDPWVAAMHLKGLLEQDLFDKRLLGAAAEVDAATIERAA
jgi:hypothetical protein